MKQYIGYGIAGLLFLAAGYLGWDIWNMKIDLSYWNGIKNVNQILDCKGRAPEAWELVRLRNTNTQSCQDLDTFLNHSQPEVSDGK